MDKVAYKLEIDSENDYQTKITIRNISDDTIMGWNIKFNTSMKKITSDIGEIKKQYDYYTFVHNQDIVIKPNQVFSFHVYGDKIDEENILRTLAIFKIACPEASIRIAGGKKARLSEETIEKAFRYCTDSTIVGNYLTTTGFTPDEDEKLINKIGRKLKKCHSLSCS